MKECYFTPENIDEKSKSILYDVSNTVRQRNFDLQMQNSALLVLDMQNFFLEKTYHAFIPASKSIISNVRKLIELYKTNNRPVIFTKHINNPENAGMMGIWWQDLIKKDSVESQIVKELVNFSDVIIEKSQYDAFYSTNLKEILDVHNIKELVIVGVMTHLCCETTARSAFVQGYKVFFPIDATATYNEAFHRAAILNLSHGFVVPVLTHQILEKNLCIRR